MSVRRWTWIDAPLWVWAVLAYVGAVALTPLILGVVPATPVGWTIVALTGPVVLAAAMLAPDVIAEGVGASYRWAVVDGWRNPGGPDADALPLRVLYVAARVALVMAPLVLVGWLLVQAGPATGEVREAVAALLDPHFRATGEAAP